MKYKLIVIGLIVALMLVAGAIGATLIGKQLPMEKAKIQALKDKGIESLSVSNLTCYNERCHYSIRTTNGNIYYRTIFVTDETQAQDIQDADVQDFLDYIGATNEKTLGDAKEISLIDNTKGGGQLGGGQLG